MNLYWSSVGPARILLGRVLATYDVSLAEYGCPLSIRECMCVCLFVVKCHYPLHSVVHWIGC